MRIQVNSDRTVDVTAGLKAELRSALRKTLARHEGRLTRAEIYLSDINGVRGGSDDKQCLLEVRPAGLDPLVVTNTAATVEEACKGASRKMLRKLSSRFGRLGK